MKNLKKYLSKKQYIIFILSLVIIILSSFSYAFYYNIDVTEENIAKTDCFKLTFSDQNDINLDKAYPLSDQESIELTPYEFTITNVCNSLEDYQVNVETLNESNLPINNIRYKVDNNISQILGNQEEVLTYINSNTKDSRKIITGSLSKNESITYNLRLWIDENSTPEESANKVYKSKVVIIAEPKQEVELHLNGGTLATKGRSLNPTIKRTLGKQIEQLPNAQKIGYDFEGWYKDSALKNIVLESTVVTNQLTDLYAKYFARDDTKYIVEHYQMDTEGNYPETPYESEELYGTSDTNVTPETKVYEHFTSPAKQTVNINADGSQVVKYYYERNKYTQTTQGRYMDTSGSYGSYSNVEEKDVYYGATYSYSAAQTAEYAAVSVADYTVTEPKTNQVSFERRQYTQTTQGRYMNTSGSYGSYSTLETKNVYYGANYSYSKAATTEYAAASVASYKVTAAKTNQISFARRQYAQTTQGRYMNTSGSYGSYSNIETKNVYYGANYSYSKAATAEYAAASVASYKVTGAKTNQISFARRQYTQTTQGRYMNTSGSYGSYSNLESKNVYYGANYSYSKAATTEYAAASVASYKVTAAKTNQISFARNKYTVTYNANGGSVSPTSASVYYNASTNLPTPSRSGYSFQGWYTATSGGSKYSSPYKVTGKVTMYAQWKKNSPSPSSGW